MKVKRTHILSFEFGGVKPRLTGSIGTDNFPTI